MGAEIDGFGDELLSVARNVVPKFDVFSSLLLLIVFHLYPNCTCFWLSSDQVYLFLADSLNTYLVFLIVPGIVFRCQYVRKFDVFCF